MLNATNWKELKKQLRHIQGKAIFKLERVDSMNDGTFYRVLHQVKPHEECLSICSDMGIENGEHEIEYEWYEIGEGESDTDEFFDEKELLRMKREDRFEEYMKIQGYEIDLIEYGTIMIEVQEDE